MRQPNGCSTSAPRSSAAKQVSATRSKERRPTFYGCALGAPPLLCTVWGARLVDCESLPAPPVTWTRSPRLSHPEQEVRLSEVGSWVADMGTGRTVTSRFGDSMVVWTIRCCFYPLNRASIMHSIGLQLHACDPDGMKIGIKTSKYYISPDVSVP